MDQEHGDAAPGQDRICTASGAGIGRARRLRSRASARVIATDIDGSKLKGLGRKASPNAGADVRDIASIEALAKRFSPVDILFNAAGFVHTAPCSTARMTSGICLRSQRPLHASHDQGLLAGHARKRGGSIINVASAAGSIAASQPLHLWDHQGSRDRANQIRRGGFHPKGSAATPLSWHHTVAFA